MANTARRVRKAIATRKRSSLRGLNKGALTTPARHLLLLWQDLYDALHAVLERAAAAEALSIVAVEYHDAQGNIVQVVKDADLRRINGTKALYVAVTSARPAACGNASSLSDDDESTVLVDLSLSGCCGIKSTYGGLAIASSYLTPEPHGAARCGNGSRSVNKAASTPPRTGKRRQGADG